jgi:cyclopropane fatty-acyl-phospholipid synthase-like methyltransferase
MPDIARHIASVVKGSLTLGGSQNFLGAPWVTASLRLTPSSYKTPVALWLLSLSPHYFYASDRQAEARRNSESRRQLAQDLLFDMLRPDMHVIDYGCGPGYMAYAVAANVAGVEAVDVSPGVLACARVLNSARNIEYETVMQFGQGRLVADVAYSFAVVQHLTDEGVRVALSLLRRRLRSRGLLLLHFATPDDGFRTASEWEQDRTVRGRLRMRLALHCFGRSYEEMQRLLDEAGFEVMEIGPLRERTSADPDIASEHWVKAIARPDAA